MYQTIRFGACPENMGQASGLKFADKLFAAPPPDDRTRRQARSRHDKTGPASKTQPPQAEQVRIPSRLRPPLPSLSYSSHLHRSISRANALILNLFVFPDDNHPCAVFRTHHHQPGTAHGIRPQRTRFRSDRVRRGARPRFRRQRSNLPAGSGPARVLIPLPIGGPDTTKPDRIPVLKRKPASDNLTIPILVWP